MQPKRQLINIPTSNIKLVLSKCSHSYFYWIKQKKSRGWQCIPNSSNWETETGGQSRVHSKTLPQRTKRKNKKSTTYKTTAHEEKSLKAGKVAISLLLKQYSHMCGREISSTRKYLGKPVETEYQWGTKYVSHRLDKGQGASKHPTKHRETSQQKNLAKNLYSAKGRRSSLQIKYNQMPHLFTHLDFQAI